MEVECIGMTLSPSGDFGAKCVNTHWLLAHDGVRQKIEHWRKDHNKVHPHSAIGNKAPDIADEWLRRIRSAKSHLAKSHSPENPPALRSKVGERVSGQAAATMAR
jgi:transposase InsO family protein